MQPTVSVIVPAYNRARLIGETLECLLRQTLPPHELFVVDDCSSDDTVAIARSFGPRVTLIELSANSGPGAARNAGLAQASGEFVQFFDSDDLCTLDKLERQARALAESGGDVAYSAWAQCWFDADTVRLGTTIYQQGPVPGPELSAFLRGWIVFIPACLIRRDLMVRVGGYPAMAHTGEDLELLLRLILSGARFVHVAQPVLLVRQHPADQISSAPELDQMRARDRVHFMKEADALLARSGQPIGWRERLSWGARAWEASRQLAAIDPQAPRVGFHPRHAAVRRAEQAMAGLRARSGGTRLGPLFAPAPLSAAQSDTIRALGYAPVAA